MRALAEAIDLAATIATLILIADIVVHYFLSPLHPVREVLDSIVDPFLNPIRRVLPQTGMIDLSPIILYFLIRLSAMLLISILSTFA